MKNDEDENINIIFDIIKEFHNNNIKFGLDLFQKLNENKTNNHRKFIISLKYDEIYLVNKRPFEELLKKINYYDFSKSFEEELEDDEIKEKIKQNFQNNVSLEFQEFFKEIEYYYTVEHVKKIIEDNLNVILINEEILKILKVPYENYKEKKIYFSKDFSILFLYFPNENNSLLINLKLIFNNSNNNICNNNLNVNANNINKNFNEIINNNLNNKVNIGEEVYVPQSIINTLANYYDEQKIINELIDEREIKDNNFESYYLINSQWINDYKEYYNFQDIVLQCELNNNEEEQTYNINEINSEGNKKKKRGRKKRYQQNFDYNMIDTHENKKKRDIKVKYKNISIPTFLLNENNILPLIQIYNGEYYPTNFELIDMKSFENLCKFINIEISEEIINDISYKVLLGNHQLIVQKATFENSLIIYSSVGDKNILEYILIYDNKFIIRKEIEIIKNKGIKKYLSDMCINFNTNVLQYLIDENMTKVIGKAFIVSKDGNNIYNNDNKIHLLLQKENQMYKKEIDELKMKLKNEEKNSKKLNESQKNEILKLEQEINLVKSYFLSEDENLICIKFISVDQKINFTTLAKSTDPFSKIEQILYKKYPDYLETENMFLFNGMKINKNKTIEQNNIKNNGQILLKILDIDD